MRDDTEKDQHRRVRSFVRRPGRMTRAQERALSELLPVFRVPPQTDDLRLAFDRQRPLVVEIGFGNGDALAWMAANEPERNFVGIEVHEPGVGRVLKSLKSRGLENVRVAVRDAVEVLRHQARPGTLEEVRIYFPDPWPKKRHHKRRIVQEAFLALVADRLCPGGRLHLATDWQPYAEWMLEQLAASGHFENVGKPFVERPPWRPQTHFERRGARKGHPIFDLLYRRIQA
jgi:tRNA (guanine-N7-)-methyltransferase